MFKGENIIEFTRKFKDDNSCHLYLSEIKWAKGYKCKNCGSTHYSIRKNNHSRECCKCHYIESPTAGTMFHKVKFGIQKAFMIVFEMSATTRGLSSNQVAKRYSITRKTAWYFMHKVRIAMKSKQEHPITGVVQVDEFVYGGKENLKQGRSYDSKKKKLIAAVELTKTNKVSRVYFKRLEDYSSKSLKTIFDNHISKDARVYTDKWSGYNPLKSEYNITQSLSDNGNGMRQMHTIIHQVKSWLRSVYSWVHDKHIEKYLDEFSFRINRSIYKQTIFHKLVERFVEANYIEFEQIKIVTK